MMKINIPQKRLAMAVALGLGASIAQAVDFNATATLQNTLTVTNIQDLDLGSVFATETGSALADGVGVLVIGPDSTVDSTITDGSVNLTSLTSPTAAQGSVDMTAQFSLTFDDTSGILASEFDGSATTSYGLWTDGTATELVHESSNPAVPSLYLFHFDIEDVSGGVAAAESSQGAGVFVITPDFGETTYTFNIGATLSTKPTAAVETYQAGIYSGTFEVTAAY